MKPDHYASIDVNQSNDHYSSLSDVEQQTAPHYDQL